MNGIFIVVKPTLSCNIDCKHCYHPVNERSDATISSENIEKLIRIASEEYESAWFIWHGGEPLMLPLKFYKNVITLQEKYFGKDSHRVSNTIQTNGVLLDKRFMSFCREKKINVGVSFEGPCNLILREKGDAVEKNLEMMKKGGHMFSVSSTICGKSTKNMTTIYRHFIGNGMALSFSPVIHAGSAAPDMVPDAEEYADSCISVFEEWLNDKDAEMPLMPFLHYVMSALGDPVISDCAHSSCLMKWISVHPNGDIYPCAKGCPPEFRLCNLDSVEKLSDAFCSDAMKEILTMTIRRRESCISECDLYKYCNGGCSMDALFEGRMDENGGNSCRVFKKVFAHILSTMNRILDERKDISRYNRFVRDALVGRLVNPDIPNI